MPPEPAPDPLEQELAVRLAAAEVGRPRVSSDDPGDLTIGLPPGAAVRLRGALEALERLQARWTRPPKPDDFPRPFGKFRIERELGRGGHGVVFLALDTVLNRRVALKIPRPELLDAPEWRRRFLREGQAVAMLDHPGIVPILELGEVGEVCYMASAHCDGPDLAAWLKARGTPLSPRIAARLARLIAEAVAQAHARGVVHRDLKPRNILMEPADPSDGPDDVGARPRVADFGLAKRLDVDAELTGTGVVLGTPRYMAPEQGQARHDLLGPPTDVYSLGAILGEMLFGRSRIDDHPGVWSPPSRRSVPRALRAIVARCLEPEPGRRYADAGAMADDLKRFLDGRPVRAAGFSLRGFVAGAGRRPSLAAALLAMAVIAASGFIIGRGSSGGPRSPRAVAPDRSSGPGAAGPSGRVRQYLEDLRLVDELGPSDLGRSTYQIATARTLHERYRPTGTESDLRTWEWYHHQLILHGEGRTLVGHRGAVYHLGYSPDGARLGSSGDDGVRVWSVTRGAPELTLHEHSDGVNWVAFSPDGSRLATASDDRTVGLWSTVDGRRLLPPLIHRHKVVAVLFTGDGGRLVAGDRGGNITTWDATTGAAVGSQKVIDEPLEGMDLSPDGSILAVVASHAVTLWDYPALQPRRLPPPIGRPGPRFDCVAFSHDGRRFATASGSDRQVQVWETQTGQLERAFTHHTDERVLTVAFSHDDRLLLSTASDKAARLWDIETGTCVGVLADHGEWVWSGTFAPDDRSAATGAGDGTIKIWSIPHRGAETRFERLSPPGLAMAFTADGTSLLTATSEGVLADWDPATGRARGFLPFRPARPSVDAALAPGAQGIAVVDAEGTLSIGSPLSPGAGVVCPRAAAARPCLAFSPDGKSLAYVAADGAVTQLDPTARPPRPSSRGRLPFTGTCLAFTPDGGLLAGDIEGRLFALRGPSQPVAEAIERGHRGRVTCLVVSADGRLCATGGEDATIVLWDLGAFRIRARLGGHERAIDALAFTPDGRTLVSIADRVQLWNTSLSQPTIRLAGSSDRPSSLGRLAMSANGRSIAALVNQPGGVQGLVWHAARQGPE